MLQAIGRRVFLFISALHIHEIIVYCGKVCKGACCVSCITSPARDAHFDDGRELARLLQAVTLGQPCPISHLPVGPQRRRFGVSRYTSIVYVYSFHLIASHVSMF